MFPYDPTLPISPRLGIRFGDAQTPPNMPTYAIRITRKFKGISHRSRVVGFHIECVPEFMGERSFGSDAPGTPPSLFSEIRNSCHDRLDAFEIFFL